MAPTSDPLLLAGITAGCVGVCFAGGTVPKGPLLPVKFRERDPQRSCDTCFKRLEPIQRSLSDQVSNAAQVWPLPLILLSIDGILNVPDSAAPARIFLNYCPVFFQVATHDVTDSICMRGWLNSPVNLSMEQEIYKATNTVRGIMRYLPQHLWWITRLVVCLWSFFGCSN